jgi:cytochrome oxidase assembly protein ShyY1
MRTGIFRSQLVLLLGFVAALCALGYWQLQRAEEKRQIQEELNSAQTHREASPDELIGLKRSGGRWMRLHGYFDNEHIWYLDNRTHMGRVGFEVIVPFRDERGWLLLINRGFWEGTPRRDLPPVKAVHGKHSLRARVHQPRRAPLVLRADVPQSKWPQLIQSVEMSRMWETLGKTNSGFTDLSGWQLFPHVLRLGKGEQGAHDASWHYATPWLSVERHTGYAITWFMLAAVLLTMGAWQLYKDRGTA